MLTFRQYLGLSEVFQASETSGVKFDSEGHALVHRFSVDGEDFEVILTKHTAMMPAEAGQWARVPIENTYDILFSGPDDFQLTGSAGSKVFPIYQKLLLSIKKLFEIREVDAITFSAAQAKMLLPYERFYNTFLKPDPPAGKGFRRIGTDLYVSKEFIRKNSIGDNRDILRSMIGAERKKRASLAALKTRQRAEKEFEKVKAEMIPYENSFVFLRTDEGSNTVAWLGPILEADSFYAIYLSNGPDRSPRSEQVLDSSKIVKGKMPSERDVRQFWRDYRSNPGYKSDLQRRLPEFRDAYLDFRNRNRAGGRF